MVNPSIHANSYDIKIVGVPYSVFSHFQEIFAPMKMAGYVKRCFSYDPPSMTTVEDQSEVPFPTYFTMTTHLWLAFCLLRLP